MKEDFKLLSICIPTYNGAKYIEKNIDTILNQIQKYNLNYVEIVVSDNCSTDKIPQIMKNYVERYPDIIKYSRNEKNLGYDGNVMKCCEIAQGKFIHLFGDDDYYSPSGLKLLCEVLSKNSNLAVAVLSNYYLRNDNYEELVSRKNLNEEFILEDRIYNNDSDNFIMEVEDRAWPNTNLVFRKEYYEEIPNLSEFYKKDWLHLYIMLYIAKKHPHCYLFADKYPIVIDRVGVQTWLNNNDGPRIYFNNLWTYSFANKLGYSHKVFEWYRKKLLSEYIKNIEFRRSRNIFINFNYIVKYFYYYKDIPAFYFKYIPKFLFHRITNEIFSVRNKYHHSKRIKEKIFTCCFVDNRIFLKRINNKSIKLNLPPKELTLLDKNGRLVQLVPSYLLEDIIVSMKQLKLDEKYSKFYRYVLLARKQSYIYYSTFLNFTFCFQNIKKGNS